MNSLNHKGFSLVEVLISLAVLSIGVWGFLDLDRISLQMSNENQDLQDERSIVNSVYEALHNPQMTQGKCFNCTEYQQRFTQRFPNSTLNISPVSGSTTQLKICHAGDPCREIIVQG